MIEAVHKENGLEVFEMGNVLDNLCSKDLPDQIPENVPDKIITDTKTLIFNKHIRQSLNGLDYDVSVSHRIGP